MARISEDSQEILAQRGEVLSLIACPNPSQSPLLSIEHRHSAWCSVSRALLETQFPNCHAGLAPLELLTAHARQLAASLAQQQFPSIAHLPIESFFYCSDSKTVLPSSSTSSHDLDTETSLPSASQE